MKILFSDNDSPNLDKVYAWKKRSKLECYVVFTREGRRFRISPDHPSYEGNHLLGNEGDWGRYIYYREAEADEIEAAKADGLVYMDTNKVCTWRVNA